MILHQITCCVNNAFFVIVSIFLSQASFFFIFFLKKQTELNVNFLNFCLNILVKGDSDFLCYVARLVGHTVMILNLGVRSIKLYKCERSCKYSPGSYFLFKLNITTASRYVFFLK